MVLNTENKTGDSVKEICYHFTNTHFNMGEFSSAWYIFNCVVNIVFSITAMAFNLVILFAIRRTPTLHTPSGTLLFGLALSDLGVGLIVHPLFFSQILAKVIRDQPLFCDAGIAVEIAANALCIVSLLTVTAVSVDRYLALRLHLRYGELVTIRRAILLLVGVWLSSSTFGSLWLWQHELVKIVAISIISVSLCIASYSYMNIYRIVQHHRSVIRVQISSVSQAFDKEEQEATEINVQKIKKQAVGSFWVYCLLTVCFTPYLCTVAVIEAKGITSANRLSYELGATLIFVNSSLNPLIYCWRLREVNEAVRQMLRSLHS
ncbi:histamine H2 receptor-like [Stylophora pistillata]|uniref:histamine H2 receptor-like n=1 Tax=Stylophora pistillata TaxID=50429 RepID=UPI000C03E62E|nr:histamine H2 receptor-like [Stylophora pistillata]